MVMKSIPPKSGGELGWDLHWKPLGGLFFGSGIWRLFLHDFWRAFSIKIQAVKLGEMDRWRVSFVFSWG